MDVFLEVIVEAKLADGVRPALLLAIKELSFLGYHAEAAVFAVLRYLRALDFSCALVVLEASFRRMSFRPRVAGCERWILAICAFLVDSGLWLEVRSCRVTLSDGRRSLLLLADFLHNYE